MMDVKENGLRIYLAEISRIPLLSGSDELRLARALKMAASPNRKRARS